MRVQRHMTLSQRKKSRRCSHDHIFPLKKQHQNLRTIFCVGTGQRNHSWRLAFGFQVTFINEITAGSLAYTLMLYENLSKTKWNHFRWLAFGFRLTFINANTTRSRGYTPKLTKVCLNTSATLWDWFQWPVPSQKNVLKFWGCFFWRKNLINAVSPAFCSVVKSYVTLYTRECTHFVTVLE